MRFLPLLMTLIGLIVAAPMAQAHESEDGQPPWQRPSPWPDRIIATLTGDPARSFSVSWRTDQTVPVAIAQIAPATADARFDLAARTVKARTTSLSLETIQGPEGPRPVIHNQGLAPVHYHAVTFEELEPDSLYAYRVRGRKGAWSAWRQVRTAPLSGPVEFIFFGDAQTGIRSHVTRMFDTAAAAAPNARFAIHGGDLVNTAMYDKEWAEWFEAVGRTHQVMPAIPVAGNHDYINFEEETKLFVAEKTVTPMWRAQFALPKTPSLPPALQGTVYTIAYTEELQIFVLDSSGIAFDRQLAWLEKALEESVARWKIVTMHHPLFSFVGGNEHPAHKDRREALLEVMARQSGNRTIDLILTGHRHTYQRGAYGDDVARFAVGDDQSVETVFVVTASSTKRGTSKRAGWERYAGEQDGRFALTRSGDNTPIFAVFSVDGNRLAYEALDATGAIYDAFTLVRDPETGRKTLTNGPEAAGPERTYDTTGPYIRWDDLR